MTAATDGVPIDTFPIRLAVVRAVMGWNYDQAARATGIGSETWRTWEKGRRRCSDITTVAQQIAAVTGLSIEWLVLGGPLASPPRPEGTVTDLLPRLDSNQQPADYETPQFTGPARDELAARRALRRRRRHANPRPTRRLTPRPFAPFRLIPVVNVG